MTGLLDVPTEVILEHLLPALPLKDLGSMTRVNKHFNALATDETLWFHLTRRDFAFSPTLLAPPPPPFYRRLYLGMYSPQTYVWGSSNNSRLGNASDPRYPIAVRSRRGYIDTPAALDITAGGMTWSQNMQRDLVDACQSISGTESEKAKDVSVGRKRVAVVEMVAGGWSFTVRDQEGALYVWGQLDGAQFGWNANGWENKHCQVPEPTVLPLPCQAESMSSGRTHLLILDRDNLIWELRSWGRAYHHTAPSLTSPRNKGASARPHHIIQISAGWSHSACLTSMGEIYLWFPFSEDYLNSLTPDEQLHGPVRPPTSSPGGSGDQGEDGRTDRDLKWGQVGGSVVRLVEALPSRPVLDVDRPEQKERKKAKDTEWGDWEGNLTSSMIDEGSKVVKIASGADFLVALKGNGEVWACSVRDTIIGAWVYLPWFSGPAIKHVTAQFEWFTTYPSPASSLKGGINHARLNNLHDQTVGASIEPMPLPAFDDRTVIQVALGDHHHAALTSEGQLYTWGEGSNGQLGLGDGAHNVETPRRVKFPGDTEDGQGDQSFVFGITAGGWHTGALVLGDAKLEKARERNKARTDEATRLDREEENVERGGIRGVPEGAGGGLGMSNHQLGAPFFRIGFAGRGGQIGNAGVGRGQAQFRGMRWTRRGGGGGGGNDGFHQPEGGNGDL